MSQGKTGIIICSRKDSRRIHQKAFKKLGGIPLIENLLSRCFKTMLPVCLAIPEGDKNAYAYLGSLFPGLLFYHGESSDPLRRMRDAARSHGFTRIVRVCHDKIFVEPDMIARFLLTAGDYLYSKTFIDGTAFEVISFDVLNEAAERFSNVEHISYAVRFIAKNAKNIPSPLKSKHRLLVDYPEDVELLNHIFTELGTDCDLRSALSYLDRNPKVAAINRLPLVTVYTCAHNADRWVNDCMRSVASQVRFSEMEYLLINDASTDRTGDFMQDFRTFYPNVYYFRPESNIGLASASNLALDAARGKYIVRLDADDYFSSKKSISRLFSRMEETGAELVYPSNYHGSQQKIQHGSREHHVGGALFETRAARHVRFTEGLRGYEGLDFFLRAKDLLKKAYLGDPIFFYRQHKDSLSHGDSKRRAEILNSVLGGTHVA